VTQGNGLTRGDRNRNRKLDALREAVRRDRAVLAIDLGEDKQVAVVMDHECRVLARKTVKAKAHQLAGLLEWGAERAVKSGLAGLMVACEPTGHRWKALMGLADAALARWLGRRGVPACVLPPRTLRKPARYVPHIYTDAELAALFAQTGQCRHCPRCRSGTWSCRCCSG
jgi:hypothetical protein